MEKRVNKFLLLFFTIIIGCFTSYTSSALAVENVGTGDVVINSTNFPDDNFRHYISAYIDFDNDYVLTDYERSYVDRLDFNNNGITSLKGIEYFPNLYYLDCSENYLERVDLSKNTELIYLNLSNNKLKELDLSNNRKLNVLNVYSNSLTSLDLSNIYNLTQFSGFGQQYDIVVDTNTFKFDFRTLPGNININKVTNVMIGFENKLLKDSTLYFDNDYSSLAEYKYITGKGNLDVTLNITYSPKMIDYEGYASRTLYVYDMDGNRIGSIPIGNQVQGRSTGKRIIFNYNDQKAWVWKVFVQDTPVIFKGYAKQNLIVRNDPDYNIGTLGRGEYLEGRIEGNKIYLTNYKYSGGWVWRSFTQRSYIPFTGYSTQNTLIVRNSSGTKIGYLPLGSIVKGRDTGNKIYFTYKNQSAWVWKSLLQLRPIKYQGYASRLLIVRNSSGTTLGKLPIGATVSGDLIGNKIYFTYKNQRAWVWKSLVQDEPLMYDGFAISRLIVRNSSGTTLGYLNKGDYVYGRLIANKLYFTYNGRRAWVWMSLLN